MTNSDMPAVHNAVHKSTANINVAEDTVPINATEDTVPINATEDTVPINATEDTVPINATDDTIQINATEDTVLINATADTIQINAREVTVPINAIEDTGPINTTEDTVLIKDEEDAVSLCKHVDDVPNVLINNTFEDKTTRLVFIQKVLTIRLLQLLGVVMIMTTFVVDSFDSRFNIEQMSSYTFVRLITIWIMVFVVTFGLMIYSEKVRRTNPYRYVFLVAYPLSYTLTICYTMTRWDILEISVAWYCYWVAIVTLLAYSIFACQTQLEFVTKNAIFISYLALIVMFALIVPFIYNPNVFYILLATMLVAVDLIFTIFNLKIMTSINYRFNITPADYVDGAINLHIDYYYTFVNGIIPTVKNSFEKPSTRKRNESI